MNKLFIHVRSDTLNAFDTIEISENGVDSFLLYLFLVGFQVGAKEFVRVGSTADPERGNSVSMDIFDKGVSKHIADTICSHAIQLAIFDSLKKMTKSAS